MEQKQTKKIGKGAIYFNNPQKETQPKYKGRVTLTDGNKVYEFPLWFNGTITSEGPSEGFNIGFEISEVLNPQSRTQKPISAEEAKEGFDKVRAQMAEGEPPKEEDDVPF